MMEGYVIALNLQGDIIDEVNYSDDWHFKLIDDPQGVALERIDPYGVSDDPQTGILQPQQQDMVLLPTRIHNTKSSKP